MSYVSEVEAFLGTRLSDSWRDFAEVLEEWKCTSFHAAVMIHWMIRGHSQQQERLDALKRLADLDAELDEEMEFKLGLLKWSIDRLEKPSAWLNILGAAQRAGLSIKDISTLFEGFLDRRISLKDATNIAAALSTLQQSHPKYRI
ncbi:hypothetical protein N5J01_03345 [Stenotrophomonas sp. GD03701]|uniref:Uncharacterized protein n=1 Tax=Stenotrophomonas maltophilia TaxID=40324 RepID=A0A2J0SNB9_STEMA|nr:MULTISPECIES: hypothetical protein [Stenotrophomonas]MBA0310542.1 hypothetical protein [Stenotrophomonas maltophilia]MDH1387442.1 hypothetical protein [Stenotrophomonas sp. GD03701]MDH1392357.1 hypothetical protein [Stenotrophomonas sp. GD03702]MDQ7300962.1 hypothetical protein [Stenotrophomonas sp. Sm0581]PJK98778.1 hypothetical protein B9Y57_14070 [Stenotrophomonas maltophilia]